MKKLTPILLALVLPLLSFSYEVHIKGIAIDSMSQGVAGVKIHIETPLNHPFQFSHVLETGNDGTFELAVSVPDSIPRGVFILKFVDCMSETQARRLQYSVDRTELMVRLNYCPESPSDRRCRVEIVPRHGDQFIILTAKVHGIRPVKFKWSTGDTVQTIRIQEAGEYCVTIVDSSGCEARDCIKVDFPNQCKTKIFAERHHPDRIMLIARSEGRMPFSYMWSTGDTTPLIFITQPGEYCVKMVDAAGCISRDCIVVRDNQDSCSVKIERKGAGNLVAFPRGVPPFKFLWNTGDTVRAIHVAGPGEYCVTIHDSEGCTARACVVVKDREDSCYVKIEAKRIDSMHVELTAHAIGRGEISFLWGTGSTEASIIVSENGTYCVKIQDEAGCHARACIDVYVRDHCSVSIKRAGDHTLVAVPKGVAPFQFGWSTGEEGRAIKINAPGEYCVKILDRRGCSSSDCIEVEIGGRNNATDILGREDRATAASVQVGSIDVFPNPFIDRLILARKSDLIENSIIEIYRMDGTMIWKGGWALSKGYNEQQIFLGHIPQGLYYLIWKGQNGVHTIRILRS